MGFLKSIMKDLQSKGEQMVLENINKNNDDGERFFGSNNGHVPTRWEKAVVSLNRIVSQVSKFDPDGVDVICFGGSAQPDVYRCVKDIKSIEADIASKTPEGACKMADAFDCAFQEAYSRGFSSRPCSILVLTAGKPDDATQVDKCIKDAATKMAEMVADTEGEYKDIKEAPISITFVQIGDDEQATQYLLHLDTELTATTSAENGQVVDLVDTIKDEDIKKAMKEFQKTGGKAGTMIGVIAGAALGVGGAYVYNQSVAKKRAENADGWSGKWKATFSDKEDVQTLTVEDDRAGGLAISGYPEGVTTTGKYTTDESTGALFIQFIDPVTTEAVLGEVEDEHTIAWSNGCRWEEIPPKDVHWSAYAGAAAAGAATAGATGYLLQKKFFNKASKHESCDYVIILDRSAMMAEIDSGK